eukprot:366524-Chlamydomonas_euryale.AAC.9
MQIVAALHEGCHALLSGQSMQCGVAGLPCWPCRAAHAGRAVLRMLAVPCCACWPCHAACSGAMRARWLCRRRSAKKRRCRCHTRKAPPHAGAGPRAWAVVTALAAFARHTAMQGRRGRGIRHARLLATFHTCAASRSPEQDGNVMYGHVPPQMYACAVSAVSHVAPVAVPPHPASIPMQPHTASIPGSGLLRDCAAAAGVVIFLVHPMRACVSQPQLGHLPAS